jgi:hypothetical protein
MRVGQAFSQKLATVRLQPTLDVFELFRNMLLRSLLWNTLAQFAGGQSLRSTAIVLLSRD